MCSDVIGLPKICTNLSSFSLPNRRLCGRFFFFFFIFAITVGAPLVSNNCRTLRIAFDVVVVDDVKLAKPLAYNINHSAISSPMRSHNVPQCVLVANASALFTQFLWSLPLANLVSPKHKALFGFCRALKNFFCTVATRSFAVRLPIAGGELTARRSSSSELRITSGGSLSGSAMKDFSKTPLVYAIESLSLSSKFFITLFGVWLSNASHIRRIASLTVHTRRPYTARKRTGTLMRSSSRVVVMVVFFRFWSPSSSHLRRSFSFLFAIRRLVLLLDDDDDALFVLSSVSVFAHHHHHHHHHHLSILSLDSFSKGKKRHVSKPWTRRVFFCALSLSRELLALE